MELSHLLELVSELPENMELQYVRGDEKCTFLNVDLLNERINSLAPNGENKPWASSYLSDLAAKIIENEPFNLSGLLNNRGSYRPVLETIIAHTREFYKVRLGTAIALVWIPSKPKSELVIEEIATEDIPDPVLIYEPQIPAAKDIRNEIKKAFLAYFSNYLRLSTGKCDESKIEKYLNLYKSGVENPIKEQFSSFNSIFDFHSTQSLNSFLSKVSKKLPEMAILLTDKWDADAAQLYYEPWTFIRHYRAFLDLLGCVSPISVAILQHPEPLNIADEENLNNNQISHLRAMRTKPFLLLAGISGTGKSRIVKEFAFKSCPDNAKLRKDKTSPGNYCLVEVKPNWHDSTELLGYESAISGSYYVTPFVKFLAKAMLYPETPFFVCLDEMNLAPVEQYFAEFLSVLESRKMVEGHIKSEPLIPADIFVKHENTLRAALFNIEKPKSSAYENVNSTLDESPLYGNENAAYNILMAEGLRIPENIIVIGTVNMDETTHQFSRKVIDRAMTIEMNIKDGEQPFQSFFEDAKEPDYVDAPLPKDIFLPRYVTAAQAIASLDDEVAEFLKTNVPAKLAALNASLNDTPFKIAYRVQNELILYFTAIKADSPEKNNDAILTEALDGIMMMKVLPRIEGDEDLLGKPLKALATFTSENNLTTSAAKISEMAMRLERGHFTSFWP